MSSEIRIAFSDSVWACAKQLEGVASTVVRVMGMSAVVINFLVSTATRAVGISLNTINRLRADC